MLLFLYLVEKDPDSLIPKHYRRVEIKYSKLGMYRPKFPFNRVWKFGPRSGSKSTFSHPFKEKCISEVVRIGSVIILHVSE